MQLKILTTANMLAYEGKIERISLPTQQGQKEFSSLSLPGMFKLLPGLIKIVDQRGESKTMTIAKGIAFIDGKNIQITTSTLTSSPLKKLTELRSSQYLIELKLQKIKQEGSLEEIDTLILELEKIKADIKLAEYAE